MKARDGAGGEPDDHDHARGGRSSRLQQLLVQAGNLTGSEARVLVALIGLRTATLKQLSEATEIGRSNMYPVLESLAAKGVCEREPGKYALWSCPDPTDVLARLKQAEETRLSEAFATASRGLEEAATILADLASGTEEPPLSLADGARIGVIYLEAMDAAVDEDVLVLNRGPYAGDLEPDPTILDALARGVRAKAIWVSAELDAPDGQARQCADAYAAAGVEQRVVDRLPVSMALIGDETALLSLPNPDPSSPVAAHGAAIRHRGMVELLSAAFDHLWESGRPYPGPGTGRKKARPRAPRTPSEGDADG